MGSKPAEVSRGETFRTWVRVAALSFGGPAGQIAVMHRILVEEKRWLSEGRFLHALNYCMVLPGPEAQQLATYCGWLLHGWRGGLVAGGLFILPGFASILVLSVLYAGFREATVVQALFFGIKAAVLAVVALAVVRIARRALRTWPLVLLATAAFVALFVFALPFPAVILAAGLAGFLGYRWAPQVFLFEHETADASADTDEEASGASLGRTLGVLAVWLPLWLVPLALLAWGLGFGSVFTQIGLFFSKMSLVSFGGAYSVLAYVAQEAVQQYGWLDPGEMLDGLGMAETTPGPLIQVVQFVGFMGAYRFPGGLEPVVAGVLASVLVTWLTFVPCFLWIFLGAPWIESLRGLQTLNATLSAVTAAVVGVMANLAAWFAVHVLFARVSTLDRFGMHLVVPEWASIQWVSLGLAVSAFIALFRFRVGMLTVLLVSALLGMGYFIAVGGVAVG